MARFLCTVKYEEKGHEVLIEVWLENAKPEGATSREEGRRRAAPFLFPVSLFPCSSPTP